MKKERKLPERKNSKPSVYELKDQQEGNKKILQKLKENKRVCEWKCKNEGK